MKWLKFSWLRTRYLVDQIKIKNLKPYSLNLNSKYKKSIIITVIVYMQNIYSDQYIEELTLQLINLNIDMADDVPKKTNIPPIIQINTSNIPIPQIFIDLKKEWGKRENKRDTKLLEQRKMFNYFLKSMPKDKWYQISELVEIYICFRFLEKIFQKLQIYNFRSLKKLELVLYIKEQEMILMRELLFINVNKQ